MKKLILSGIIILSISLGMLIGVYVIPVEAETIYINVPVTKFLPMGGYDEPTIVKPESIPESITVDPVDSPIITSEVGVRVSPITGLNSIHYATDMYSEESMNVYATKDGVVVLHYPPPNGYFKGHPTYGGLIEILHNDGLSRYGHMSETYVQEGQSVKAGDIIGRIGDTGLSRGLHLHYEYFMKLTSYED